MWHQSSSTINQVFDRSFFNCLFISLLALSSCKKKNDEIAVPVSASGYVISHDETDSIEDCLVELYEEDGNSLDVRDHALVATSQTDHSGYFKFSFSAKENYSYGLRAVKSKYQLNPQISRILSVLESPSNVKVRIAPLYWIKLNISDSPALEYDSVKFWKTTVIPPNDTVLYDEYPTYRPNPILQWFLYKDGTSIHQVTQVGCSQPFDTCTLNIAY